MKMSNPVDGTDRVGKKLVPFYPKALLFRLYRAFSSPTTLPFSFVLLIYTFS